ncbi:MAG: ATP-dependent RecD-like DNA helicase [Lachnospiraceae bacterium]|nr:ATP-dependent RecD-like DNA helicase [Lachnospiraceae bacterium]
MEKIRGYIDHIIYRNTENGYTVMELIADGEEITCVGFFQTITQGENLEAEGDFVEHPVYGEQFKMQRYKIIEPDDVVSMERYLASGAVKGIGPSLASRIIRKFGEETFRIMEEEPERLAEIKGISEAKAREIGIQMEEKRELREAMLFLQKYGISNTLAVRIYEEYGNEIYSVLQENPYRLADDIAGIGFKTADEIAARIGIHTDSDYRIRSGILYTLLQAAADGNVYLPKPQLLARTSQLLGVKEEYLEPQLGNLMMDKKLVMKEKDGVCQVYGMSYYYAELNCARMLKELDMALAGEGSGMEAALLDQKLGKLEQGLSVQLDTLQREAVRKSIENGIFILSGGPGTGKTTTINMMIRFFMEEGLDLYLAAPTGRAAKRMSEATGYEAKTIHRLLELNGSMEEDKRGASFERNEKNPLEADVVIIDEMSMVDIHLFQALLKAIVPGTRLILVGDVNQLPSVGPGQVLRDLIESGCFSVTCLKKIFRQAEESDIVVNAHTIHEGRMVELNNKSRDFFFLERNDANVIYKHMIQLIQDKLPHYVNATPFDIQVLTPMRKGNLGVETLNVILQKYLNPQAKDKREYMYGERLFREGDKVMQTKNNYQLEWEIQSRYGIPIDKGVGVFNGDMGIIREISEFSQTITVVFDDVRRVVYPFAQLDELELSYAITIHKSQGSEYPAVIMPLLSGPRMLMNRNLLYTGITRARDCVTILGSKETFHEMVENESQQKRLSGLSDRIQELMLENG